MPAELKVYNFLPIKSKIKMVRSVFIEEKSKCFACVFKLFSEESKDL